MRVLSELGQKIEHRRRMHACSLAVNVLPDSGFFPGFHEILKVELVNGTYVDFFRRRNSKNFIGQSRPDNWNQSQPVSVDFA
mmetsp:Transcript_32428/g.127206  ORF Transcript_32428/g.127206 Transcript_32428/m.127206 type:complete len:82 (-) Transcript_32428:785-1030(-)